jgi:hypothetical protein
MFPFEGELRTMFSTAIRTEGSGERLADSRICPSSLTVVAVVGPVSKPNEIDPAATLSSV